MYLHCPVDWPTLPDSTTRYDQMKKKRKRYKGTKKMSKEKRSKNGWAERVHSVGTRMKNWRDWMGWLKNLCKCNGVNYHYSTLLPLVKLIWQIFVKNHRLEIEKIVSRNSGLFFSVFAVVLTVGMCASKATIPH